MESFEVIDREIAVPLALSRRDFKLIRLSNGLLVLLVSEPREDVGGISLSVLSGSNSDTSPGIAHLVEHMLFRGNKLNRDPNHFTGLMNSCGGKFNASTSSEHTSFFCEFPIKDRKMEAIVEAFANMFKAPLFNMNYVFRELQLINNEHLNNIKSRDKIMYYGLRLLAREDHQFHAFATGNRETLSSVTKRDLTNFYKKHYRASNMLVVIRGPQSTNQLTKMIVSHFNDQVNDTNTEPEQFDDSLFDDYNLLVMGKPDSIETAALRIEFPVKCSESDTQTSLLCQAWCHLFGDETEGSLHLLWSSQNLITSISAFVLSPLSNYKILTLELEITDNFQLGSLNQMLSDLFNYCEQNFHNNLPKNHRYWGKFLNEFSRIEKLNFIYQDPQTSTMDELKRILLYLLSRHDPKWCLRGGPNWEDTNWDQQGRAFIGFVNEMVTAENVKLILMMKYDFFNQFDRYYELDYFKTKFTLNYQYKFNPSLHMPFPNRFVPSFAKDSVLDSKLDHLIDMSRNSSFAPINKLSNLIGDPVSESQLGIEVWYQREKTPNKCLITLELSSDSVNNNIVYMELLCELINMSICHAVYPLAICDYTWDLYPCLTQNSSLMITVSGFSDGIHRIVELILRAISKDSTKLQIAKNNVITKLKRLREVNGIVSASMSLVSIIEQNIMDHEQQLSIVSKIANSNYENFIASFIDQPHCKILYQGDISPRQRYKIIHSVLRKFPLLHKDTSIPRSSYMLPTGRYRFTRSSNDLNTTVLKYIQTGQRSNVFESTLTHFLSYLISLSIDGELRGRRQLGYAVISSVRVFRQTIGICISIVSGEYEPVRLDQEIARYLHTFFDKIDEFDSKREDFIKYYEQPVDSNWILSSESYFSAGVSQKLEQHRSLWEQIECGVDHIDMDLIRNLSEDQFMGFINTKLQSSLSIALKPNDNQIGLKKLHQQYKFYLNLNSLKISDTELDKIILESELKPRVINLKLIKHFATKGFNFKALSLGFVSFKVDSYEASDDAIEITDIDQFHRLCRLVSP